MPHINPARSLAPERTSMPSGMVAFLFTDVEGSTNRWERHHGAMAAWSEQQAIEEATKA